MTDYLTLVAGIACVLIALVCLLLFIVYTYEFLARRDPSESPAAYAAMRRTFRRVVYASAVGLVVTTWLAWSAYSYLSAYQPQVLRNFAVWYVLGLVSRILVLFKRHIILSPHFCSDWDACAAAFLWALLGPAVAVHLFTTLLWEKNWFEERMNL